MLRVAVTLGLLTAALAAPVATAATGDIERVSVATSGTQGDGDSTTVTRGKVTVRDLARRRTVRLDCGDRYRVRSSQARTAPQ